MDLKQFLHVKNTLATGGAGRVVSLFGTLILIALPVPAHGESVLASLIVKASAADTAPAAREVRLASVQGAALLNPTSPVTTEGPRRSTGPVVPTGARFRVLATSYSSTPDQTDRSPFITASGTHVHDGTVAANFLRFGTKIRFPNYRPDMTFIVEDRHSPRLSDRIDVWFETRAAAMQFGAQVLEMEVIE